MSMYPGGDFDSRFKRTQESIDRSHRLMSKGMKVFGVVWVLWACICLAGMAGLVYVTLHFLTKFW